MRMLSNIQSAVIVVVFALGPSSAYAVSLPNSLSSIEPVALSGVMTTSVLKNRSTHVSSAADSSNVAGTSNLFWVLGSSLVALSLVTRRLSV